jgi:hypothetical protein
MEKPNTKMARTAKNRARSFRVKVRNFKLTISFKEHSINRNVNKANVLCSLHYSIILNVD